MKWLGVFLFLIVGYSAPLPLPASSQFFQGDALWELSVSPLNSTHWFGQASNADLSIRSSHSFIILLIMGCTLPFRTIQQMWYLVNSMSEKYSRFLLEYRSLTSRSWNNHGFKLICNVQFNFSLLKGSCIFFPHRTLLFHPLPKAQWGTLSFCSM